MIFVSTGGRRNKTAWETAIELAKMGIKGVELSGGKSSNDVYQGVLKAASYASLQPHNYFPPPHEPFVLNLASNNERVYSKSISHVKAAIDLASSISAKTYSFHAGFLIDPKPSELGKQVTKRGLSNRNDAISLFVNRCNHLAEYAKEKGVRLLIENNVLSYKNYREFGANPFLMADINECIEVMSQVDNTIGLLVDVAHLKVSAKTLGFQREDFLDETDQWIQSYHISDNDGLSDTNESINRDSWFWQYLKPEVEDIVIEVYSDDNSLILQQYNLVNELRG